MILIIPDSIRGVKFFKNNHKFNNTFTSGHNKNSNELIRRLIQVNRMDGLLTHTLAVIEHQLYGVAAAFFIRQWTHHEVKNT